MFGFAAARLLGSAGFGHYAVLSAFLSYFMVVTDFGLSPLLVREMSRRPDERSAIFAGGLMLRLVLAVLSFVVLFAIALALGWPPLFLQCLLIGGLGVMLYAWNSTLTDFLTACEKLRFAAAVDIACQTFFLAAVLLLLWITRSLLAIFLALFAANALRAIILGMLARRELPSMRWWELDVAACRSMMTEVATFALLGLLGTLYFKIDILILYAYAPAPEIGWYEGAYRFLEALMVLNVSLMAAMFPGLSRLGSDATRRAELQEIFLRATRFLVWSGAAGALTVTFLAKPLIRFCYGADFLPAVPLVPILMAALILIHLNAPLGRILLALHEQKKVMRWSFVTVGANIALNLLLIPIWGAHGAAITTLLSEILSFFIFYPMVRAALGPLPWRRVFGGFDKTDIAILWSSFPPFVRLVVRHRLGGGGGKGG